ncbi:hypothetical protein F5Y19DRAFT_486179 [Xylariaceae sp. FL1651]|nr:hypothetical protein F5Y19DRAFT_486179 [Xylariaceae sp. FL1651]
MPVFTQPQAAIVGAPDEDIHHDNTHSGDVALEDDEDISLDLGTWFDPMEIDNTDFDSMATWEPHNFMGDAMDTLPSPPSNLFQGFDTPSPNYTTPDGGIFTAGFDFDFDINFDSSDNPTQDEDDKVAGDFLIAGTLGTASEQGKLNHGSKTRRFRLNKSQSRILEEWVFDHNNPYPTKRDKEELSKQIGLDISQINSWFSRTRQRRLQRISYPILRSVTVSRQIEGHREAPLPPQNISSRQGNWFGGGSLPSRPNSPSRRQSINQRSRSLPPYYTLGDVSQHLKEDFGGSYDGKLSLKVITSDVNDHVSTTNQTVAKLSSRRFRQAFHLTHIEESSKTTTILNWLRETSICTASVLLTQGVAIETRELQLSTLPRSSAPKVHYTADQKLDFRRNLLDLSRRDMGVGKAYDDTQDTASIALSAGRSATSTASLKSTGSYQSFGSRRGRRMTFHPRKGEPIHSSGPCSRPGATEREGLQFTEKRPERSLSRATIDSETSCLLAESSTRKRKREESMNYISKEPLESPRRYECTFCEASFGRPYTWRRHEESAHAPQQLWVCALPQHFQEETVAQCPICEKSFIANTNEQEGCAHGFLVCWSKAKEDRTFYRKDGLQQHLLTVHIKDENLRHYIERLQLDSWTEDISTKVYDLRCYFCGYISQSWSQRAKHIVAHFTNGKTMRQWQLAKQYRFFPPISESPAPFQETDHQSQAISGLERGSTDTPPNIYESLLRP